jgi:hypothetical protein
MERPGIERMRISSWTEVGEYQGGFRDRVDGLMVCVERG